MEVTLRLSDLYPIILRETEQLCADGHTNSNRNESPERLKGPLPTGFFSSEPRVLLGYHGRCYADTQCGRWYDGIPRVVW